MRVANPALGSFSGAIADQLAAAADDTTRQWWDRYLRPFELGHIEDWSTCDWYCVKVLGRFVDSGEDRRRRAERELSRGEPARVQDFVDEHRASMSREALKAVTSRLG